MQPRGVSRLVLTLAEARAARCVAASAREDVEGAGEHLDHTVHLHFEEGRADVAGRQIGFSGDVGDAEAVGAGEGRDDGALLGR